MSGAYSIEAYKAHMEQYLSQLKGCTILDCQVIIDDEDAWPVLIVSDKDMNLHQLEIYCDPEANGPGHIFIGDVVFDLVE